MKSPCKLKYPTTTPGFFYLESPVKTKEAKVSWFLGRGHKQKEAPRTLRKCLKKVDKESFVSLKESVKRSIQ
ncbi:hypothetical protein RRG08_048905 [Elysia crispata]|uniref:Uncharacterized protein n=1 Tax=Elysia crispata TaxID=231223 RepID=A0AAE0YT81_9GAST|nr:hypothetical protein RRG08_048905 [Elysia crispata]